MKNLLGTNRIFRGTNAFFLGTNETHSHYSDYQYTFTNADDCLISLPQKVG